MALDPRVLELRLRAATWPVVRVSRASGTRRKPSRAGRGTITGATSREAATPQLLLEDHLARSLRQPR